MAYRYKMKIAYDGTQYSGWQVQPSNRTVQGELERLLGDMSCQKVRVESATRALLLYLAVFVCMDAFTWHGCIMSGVWGSDFNAATQKTCYAYSGKVKAALSAGFAAFVLFFFRWEG